MGTRKAAKTRSRAILFFYSAFSEKPDSAIFLTTAVKCSIFRADTFFDNDSIPRTQHGHTRLLVMRFRNGSDFSDKGLV